MTAQSVSTSQDFLSRVLPALIRKERVMEANDLFGIPPPSASIVVIILGILFLAVVIASWFECI